MSSTLIRYYNQYYERFAALTTRERALSLVAGLCLIIVGGFVLYIEPQVKALHDKETEAQRQSALVAQLNQQVTQLSAELAADPNAPLLSRIEAMAQRSRDLDTQLAQRTDDLVPAHRMPNLLSSLFAEFKGLELVEMRSIEPVAMLSVDEQSTATEVNLYQHGVSLVLEGRYFDIQSYLLRVENLPWHFYWKRFDYQVGDYPIAQVELEIYTLSTSKAFIGVWQDD